MGGDCPMEVEPVLPLRDDRSNVHVCGGIDGSTPTKSTMALDVNCAPEEIWNTACKDGDEERTSLTG
eukprot:12895884-Prorocentrum_lima.AAC.1